MKMIMILKELNEKRRFMLTNATNLFMSNN